MHSTTLQRFAEQVLIGAVLAVFWTGVLYLIVGFSASAFLGLFVLFTVTCLVFGSIAWWLSRRRLYRQMDRAKHRVGRIQAMQRQADNLALSHRNHYHWE